MCNLQLPILHFIPHIPDKFSKFMPIVRYSVNLHLKRLFLHVPAQYVLNLVLYTDFYVQFYQFIFGERCDPLGWFEQISSDHHYLVDPFPASFNFANYLYLWWRLFWN